MQEHYDVAVLGAGIGGGLLGAILARHGKKVAIIDKVPHPRFAVGESTIPYTTQALAVLSELFDVPELFPRAIRKAIGNTSGVKRHFGYVYHRPGEVARADEVSMVWLGEPEFHFFRQDVDAHLFHVAVRYGAEPIIGAGVRAVHTDADGAVVQLDDGREIKAAFVVDGTGHNSVIAREHKLRMEDPKLRTHTRTLFTHMIGVKPFDDVLPQREHGMPGPLHQGTLHHVFDGGWFWVIPFDNHDDSSNPLVSVGLQIDCRRWPFRPDVSPEQEFREFAAMFPSVEKHFEGAKAVRPWVSTPRLQFGSHRATGQRWALLPHAYGFIDPLYSRGMAFTMDGVKALAVALLDAGDDLGNADLSTLDADYRRMLDAHDDLVFGSLVSWKDMELWKTWWYVWVLSAVTEFFPMLARHQWHSAGDASLMRSVDHYPAARVPGYDDYMKRAVAIMEQVDQGALAPRAANEALLALTRAQPFHYEPVMAHLLKTRASTPPSWVWNAPSLVQFARWVATEAPRDVRDLVMPFVKGRVFRYAYTTL
jgi:FADH2 O2-dependent halogenase